MRIDLLPEERFPSWSFTELFVEQLLAAITAIPSRETGGLATQRASAFLQSHVPGGRREIGAALECLEALGLVTSVGGVLARTRSGNAVRKEVLAGSASAPLAQVVLRSGFMGDQVRALREVLVLADGHYRCSRHAARSVAPQLMGLLARLSDVVVGGEIVVGVVTSREIDSLWNEILPSSRVDWVEKERRKKAIGDRAESYSMEFLRTRRPGAHSEVVWASRDDDTLGYDIEVTGGGMHRVEVKGSSGPDVIFFLTAREHEVATRHAGAYEIHFWGTVDLRVDPRVDYERLRAAGYPIRILDPLLALQSSPWSIVPDRHKVSAEVRVGAVELADYVTPIENLSS